MSFPVARPNKGTSFGFGLPSWNPVWRTSTPSFPWTRGPSTGGSVHRFWGRGSSSSAAGGCGHRPHKPGGGYAWNRWRERSCETAKPTWSGWDTTATTTQSCRCSVKPKREPAGPPVLRKLDQVLADVPDRYRKQDCLRVVFSTSGFQPALVQEAEARPDVELIDLRAIFAPIDE